MSNATTTPRRKLTNFELSDAARRALVLVAAQKGWTRTKTVETALLLLGRQTEPDPLLHPAAFSPPNHENTRRTAAAKGGRK